MLSTLVVALVVLASSVTAADRIDDLEARLIAIEADNRALRARLSSESTSETPQRRQLSSSSSPALPAAEIILDPGEAPGRGVRLRERGGLLTPLESVRRAYVLLRP